MSLPEAILIAGPTASGKSSLAIELAQKHDGVIVNADSMQIYSVLQVVTARPSEEDEAIAEHHLYGHVSPKEPYSVARWLADVRALMPALKQAGKLPVFVGGTGLYFRGLLEGLAEIPEPEQDVRDEVRALHATDGPKAIHAVLKNVDPQAAEALRPSDGQRLMRALEVYRSTGQSIVEWQKNAAGSTEFDAERVEKHLIMPDRAVLHERINSRFDQMIELGALAEVDRLAAMGLPTDASALKAIGVPQLMAFRAGELTLEDAIERAKAATRQYAKRQSTWFRNQLSDDWAILSG